MPKMTHGCRPVSATYQPANVAIMPDGVMNTKIHRNQRELKSFPRKRSHSDATPRKTLQFPLVPVDFGIHDTVRHYCDVGWLVCCGDWTAAMGYLRHIENGGRNLSCASSGALVDSDRICLRLCSLHNRLPGFCISHCSPWPR